MNETPEAEKTEAPITDAEHLLEPESEAEEPVPVATEQGATVSEPSKLPEAPEAPVKQLEEVITPAQAETSPAPLPVAEHSSGGVLVLQWLSYAFWLWCSISVSVLAGIVINYFISSSKSYQWGDKLAYPLASVIIMLAIALITDKVYAKHEPAKKGGGANVIMLLHVVPFILISIGALVTVVFSFITMLLNSDPLATVDGPIKVMLVSLIVALLFGLISARAFYGGKSKVRRATWIVTVALSVGFIVAAVAGPAADAIRTKDDRLIEQALPSLASDIRDYVSTTDKLPATLADVTHEDSYTSDAAQKLISSKLVTYKANTIASKNSTYDPGDVSVNTCVGATSSTDCGVSYGAKRFYYQLCASYKREKKSEYNYTDDADYTVGTSVGVVADYRYNYVSSISSHPAGEVCYNLYADGGYDYSKITPMSATE